MDTTRRQSAAASTSGSNLTPWGSSEHRTSVPAVDWEEPCWPEFLLTDKGPEYSLNLGTNSGRSLESLRQLFFRDCYYSFGLSPNCQLAFVLGKRALRIYFLSEPPNPRAELRAELRDCFEGEVEDAVLSNRYLVTLERYRLDTFELGADGRRLNKHFSTVLENQMNRRGWIPKCLAIFDNGRCAWVAVGFLVDRNFCSGVNRDFRSGGDIKVYLINASGITEEIGRYDEGFRSAIGDPLESEYIRRISFSPDGDRLACVTNNNTALIWSWSHSSQSWQHPFEIRRDFRPDVDRRGTLTSATLFNSPSRKPYVLCTTSPSLEREHTGEWSFISPVAPGPASMPISLQHSIEQLRESVLVGAATSVGDLIAVLEASGRVRLLRLDKEIDGGLCCHASQDPVLEFNNQLCPQDSAPPTSLRFQETLRGLQIFAIDRRGKLIVKTLTKCAYPPLATPIPLEPPELPSSSATQLDSHPIHQLEDLAAPDHNASPPDPQAVRHSPRRVQLEPGQRLSRRRSLP